ncbi:MAG: hypothetical protein L3K09_04025 [Thermoplasmata archaeon]|nr:hypothetical protein [Thermoplasmata archaeon]
MTSSDEESRAREHLSELRRAARGLGHDFTLELRAVEKKIERLPSSTAKETKYLVADIEDDLSRLSRSMKTELRKVPGGIKGGLETAGSAISGGASRAYTATRDAASSAGHSAVEGTRDAFARAAGVKRKPMKEWRHPSGSESAAASKDSDS